MRISLRKQITAAPGPFWPHTGHRRRLVRLWVERRLSGAARRFCSSRPPSSIADNVAIVLDQQSKGNGGRPGR